MCLFAALALPCKDGWVSRSDSCYKFVTEPKADWATAEDLCAKMGARLATLETLEEIIWMHGYRSYHTELRKSNAWVGGFEENQAWYWKGSRGDNYPIEVTDWAAHQPDNLNGNQDCLSLFGEHTDARAPVGQTWFRFDDDGCFVHNSYVCEHDVDILV